MFTQTPRRTSPRYPSAKPAASNAWLRCPCDRSVALTCRPRSSCRPSLTNIAGLRPTAVGGRRERDNATTASEHRRNSSRNTTTALAVGWAPRLLRPTVPRRTAVPGRWTQDDCSWISSVATSGLATRSRPHRRLRGSANVLRRYGYQVTTAHMPRSSRTLRSCRPRYRLQPSAALPRVTRDRSRTA